MPVHPSAVVGAGAMVAASAEVGPMCVVEDGVVVGERCRLLSHVVLRRGVVLGARVVLHAGVVLGGEPQDARFDPAVPTGVRVGDGAVLREHVTVSRATRPGGETVIGPGVMMMASSHVGHDGSVGEGAILANGAMVAGHVELGARVFVGGGAGFHQFVRIGAGVMVAGLARVTRDVPPFTMVAERDELIGLNVVGLRRRPTSREAMAELKEVLRAVCGGGNPRERAAERLAAGVASAEAREFLVFFGGGKRGFVRLRTTDDTDHPDGG